MESLRSFEGAVDPHGYALRVTKIATADELAGAAGLVMGKLDRTPVALIRGYSRALACPGAAHELVRAGALDLFR